MDGFRFTKAEISTDGSLVRLTGSYQNAPDYLKDEHWIIQWWGAGNLRTVFEAERLAERLPGIGWQT